jgi:hypothetical protein
MKEISAEERSRYYKEVSIRLREAGFEPRTQEDRLLPVDWQGSRLCLLTAGGGAQFREEYLDRDGGRAAFDRVTDIAASTAEYMRLMQAAPPLQATGLDSSYRMLADFGGAVLAGHPTKRGMEFVTWEWDYPHTGMWQGHYHGGNYAEAKRDFAVRSGLIPREMVFSEEQLTDLCRCCTQALASPESSFSYEDAQRIVAIQEQIERLCPGTMERAAAQELEQPHQTQAMY